MNRILPRLLAIGADPHDDADLRLRKVLVLSAMMMITPAALIWGAIYWALGETTAALIPWSYVVINVARLPIYAFTHRYRSTRSWRFRIGLNSGEALVGNIGSYQFRNFTAIGDTVNMAQRFQTLAQPGQVVTGLHTTERLGDAVDLEWLDEVQVKGKTDPVRPCILRPVGH